MTIFNETVGQGDKVVILHGLTATHNYMQPIVEQLSDKYCVMNFDLPGRGQSQWQPGTTTIDEMADQLLPYLPPQAIYIGWSFGGLLCFSIAARYPERVKQVIGVSASPKFIASSDWPGFPQPGFSATLKPAIQQNGFVDAHKAFFQAEFESFHPKPQAYSRIISILENEPEADLDVLFQCMEIVDHADLRQAFSTITCPIDLILGSEDGAFPVATRDKIKALAPHMTEHLIDGAQHIPFFTHPQQFNSILSSVIGGE